MVPYLFMVTTKSHYFEQCNLILSPEFKMVGILLLKKVIEKIEK